jgi:KDO2-lipid IV(A) lauroyltransferase
LSRRPRFVTQLRRRSATALGRVLAALAQLVPEARSLALGAAAGRAVFFALPARRRRAQRNLHIAFPDWGPERVEATARRSFEELGRSLAEWARLPRLVPEDLRQRVAFHGLEHAERALAAGRGAFFATAHYGNWELLPAAWRAAVPDRELVVVGRRFDDPGLQASIERRRVLGGGSLLRRDAREILHALRRGAAVGVLVDLYTPARRGGILVPFFGRPAWTTAGPATLALRTGAPILPVHIRRVDGPHHRVEFAPPLEVPASGDRERDIREFTGRMTAALEAAIRAHPDGWLWLHRRWKRSPAGESP